jgi:hypothetical protein
MKCWRAIAERKLAADWPVRPIAFAGIPLVHDARGPLRTMRLNGRLKSLLLLIKPSGRAGSSLSLALFKARGIVRTLDITVTENGN